MVRGAIQSFVAWIKGLNRPLSIWWRCKSCNCLVFDTDKSRVNHVGHQKLRWARPNLLERVGIRWNLYPDMYE